MNRTLTAVPRVQVGHWTHESGTTGATVVRFQGGARAGFAQPGSAPGSRELGVLDPGHLAGAIDAVCLAGGSAFGLAAADGVMDFLEERGIGFDAGVARVPIVPALILFDLRVALARPDRASGYAAALDASEAPVVEGAVGAGAGARVAKVCGLELPGGIGSFSARTGEYTVGALLAVNAFGAIRDPDSGAWVAGGPAWAPALGGDWRGNTTLAVVATDAPLSRPQCSVLAKMAQAGLARTIYPAFAPFDGDSVIAASTGVGPGIDAITLARLGDVAASCVAQAVLRGSSEARRVDAVAS